MNITELLKFAVRQSASDLHLSAGMPPILRIEGDLHKLDAPILDNKTISNLFYSIMDDKHQQEFESKLEVDFSFEIRQLSRFRVNIFRQHRGIAGVIRIIPWTIKTLAELNIPTVVNDLCYLSHGLVLVTGPTGSGKSTTLAAMIDFINENKNVHILTIEDPIEFIHPSKKALIHQREIKRDTKDFNSALRSALREDPDIILVGELRDPETIRLALTASETGHLVLGTLHTTSAAKSINRIIDVFAGGEKNIVRTMLSESLQAIIAQNLLKKLNGGRIAALELMRCTPAIRNLIREDKVAQMYSCIQTNRSLGMQTLDQHLEVLVKNHMISSAVAQEMAINKAAFNQVE